MLPLKSILSKLAGIIRRTSVFFIKNTLKKLFSVFNLRKQSLNKLSNAPNIPPYIEHIEPSVPPYSYYLEQIRGIVNDNLRIPPIQLPIRTAISPNYNRYGDIYYNSAQAYPSINNITSTESHNELNIRNLENKLADVVKENEKLKEKIAQMETENYALRDRIKNERDGIKDLQIEDNVV